MIWARIGCCWIHITAAATTHKRGGSRRKCSRPSSSEQRISRACLKMNTGSGTQADDSPEPPTPGRAGDVTGRQGFCRQLARPARRLSDAGRARRDSLCRQGAQLEKPRRIVFPAEQCSAQGPGADRQDRQHGSHHHELGYRGAAARVQPHQETSGQEANVVLRDEGKSFPYLHLETNHEFPRLNFYRGSRKEPGKYFGPYPSAGAVRDTMQQLQKLFLHTQLR